MKERDLRRNLQSSQDLEGNRQVDQNGWPVPLSDPSNPLKFVVTNGKRGTQNYFRAMSTDGQNEISLAEGHSSVSQPVPEGLNLKVKVTEADSTD